MNVEQINNLIIKTIDVLKNVFDIYDKKSRGQPVAPTDFINILSKISRQDLDLSLELLQSMRKRKFKSLDDVINMKSPTSHARIVGQTSQETAIHVIRAMLQSIMSKNEEISSDELIKTLGITDEKTIKVIKKEYEQAIKDAKKLHTNNTIDKKLYIWARVGQVMFYGGILLVILILFRKLYEFLIDVTDAIRIAIVKFINPTKSRYYMSLLNFFKKHRNKSRKNHGNEKEVRLFARFFNSKSRSNSKSQSRSTKSNKFSSLSPVIQKTKKIKKEKTPNPFIVTDETQSDTTNIAGAEEEENLFDFVDSDEINSDNDSDNYNDSNMNK